jgi:hypothetical protein
MTINAPAPDFGIKPMQVAPAPPGSNGSIHQNNTALTNRANDTQVKAKFGGAKSKRAKSKRAKSKRAKSGGAKGGAVTVPPIQINYKETGVNNTSTQANVTASIRTQSDLYAAKQYDGLVGQKAGRKLTKGGWPAWGCMSGGKRSKRKSCKHKSCKRSKRKRSSCKKSRRRKGK